MHGKGKESEVGEAVRVRKESRKEEESKEKEESREDIDSEICITVGRRKGN